MATQGSRLAQMKMRFQQKQQEEREQKRVDMVRTKPVSGGRDTDDKLSATLGAGKVRQMFDERRQRSTGIDKSYPLQPIAPRTSPSVSKTTVTTTVRRTTTVGKQTNGTVKPLATSARSGGLSMSINDEVDNLANRLNGNAVISDSGDLLDNEKFPDDESFGQSIKHVANGKSILNNNNNTTIKLKPVITKKSSVGKPVQSFNPTKRLTPVEPPKLKSAVSSASSKSSTQSGSSSGRSNSMKTITPKKPPVTKSGPPPPDHAACSICGRFFLEDRIAKHETICQKAAAKKRKIFDASKKRVEGTEAEQFVKKATRAAPARAKVAEPAAGAKKSDWRRKHEEFIAAIRAAKELKAHLARGGKLSDMPPPPPSENPDYVQCPHCQRRFNEAAAQRHIPKCANFQHNKPKPASRTVLAPKKRY